MPCHLDAEPDFAVDFCLLYPAASSQPFRLLDGKWELGTFIQTVMLKSLVQIETSLQEHATYASFNTWLLVLEDWVSSYTHTMPDNLVPVSLYAMAYLTISLDVYSWLETCGMLGTT